ncbi:MAG TPA: DUF6498-containing protein [Steroidobacteraceae bacterium]|jgi:hypothetical protein|nr:DUF6498-containing protein [Steroidobacteraceae bacterium]
MPESARMVAKDSTRLLIVSNAITVVAALVLHWPIETLMWPYWIQSVIIGWYSRRRMLALHQFSTEGFTSNGQPVPETPRALRSTANFFAIHYGFFHLGYLVFLWQHIDKLSRWDWLAFAGLSVSFVMSHGASFRQNLAADVRGRPNLGALLFLPYLRILPMHLTLIFGRAIGGDGAGALLLFGVLKTLADVGMHYADHKMLQRGVTDAAFPPAG